MLHAEADMMQAVSTLLHPQYHVSYILTMQIPAVCYRQSQACQQQAVLTYAWERWEDLCIALAAPPAPTLLPAKVCLAYL